MNFRTIAIVAALSCLLITPSFSLPLGLDSHSLGKLAVPLISIGGSVFAGKVISDYLEGRGVLGVQAFPAIHADAFPGHGLLLASPLHALPLPALPLAHASPLKLSGLKFAH